MGGDIRSGEMHELDTEAKRKFFQNYYHETLDEVLTGDQHVEERERRHDEGPPIFRVGETIELRGARFRLTKMDRKGLRLKLLKG